jgi:hypothetical protein
VYAGHAITYELLGNVCQSVSDALLPLRFGERRPLANPAQRACCPVSFVRSTAADDNLPPKGRGSNRREKLRTENIYFVIKELGRKRC